MVDTGKKSDNEFARVNALHSYDLDYTQPEETLNEYTQLAAHVVGAEISLVNLIDTYTQWSIARYGIDLLQTPREESACQFTIEGREPLEIDFRADPRFKDKEYVKKENGFRHYYGIPLTTSDGHNLGALCVVSSHILDITKEKARMLGIIAHQVVEHLDLKHALQSLRKQIRTLGHDVRSPVSGIISLSELLKEQIEDGEGREELLDSCQMIEQSGKELLELAEAILQSKSQPSQKYTLTDDLWNAHTLRNKIIALYAPQAQHKNIKLEVYIKEGGSLGFPKDDLIQIIGNLVGNSIKFTPMDGSITIWIDVQADGKNTTLTVGVKDTGIGMDQDQVESLASKNSISKSSEGTENEKGFGYGLAIAKDLMKKLNGSWEVRSERSQGTEIVIKIPYALQSGKH